MIYNLILDGITYPNVGITSIHRKGEVRDDDTTGDTLSGLRRRGVVGTFYHYDMVLNTELLNPWEYDRLYYELSAPVSYHSLTAPFGQTILTQNVYIELTDDDISFTDSRITSWENLVVSFIAAAPTRVPT